MYKLKLAADASMAAYIIILQEILRSIAEGSIIVDGILMGQ